MTETQKEQIKYINKFIANPDISSRIDCVLDEVDFCTSYPNPYRLDRTISEINRYLKYKGYSRNN